MIGQKPPCPRNPQSIERYFLQTVGVLHPDHAFSGPILHTLGHGVQDLIFRRSEHLFSTKCRWVTRLTSRTGTGGLK